VSSFGEGFFYTPEDQAQQEGIRCRQAYAQALMQARQHQGQYGGLADAGDKIAGALMGKRADKDAAKLATDSQSRYATDLSALLRGNQGAVSPGSISNSAGTPQETDPEGNPMAQAQPPQSMAQAPQSFADRVAGSGNPALMFQFGPDIIKQQMQMDAKRVTPMSPQEVQALGLRGIWGKDGAGNPVPIQQSDVKSPEAERQQIRIDQGKGLLTPEEEAQRVRIARESRPAAADPNKPPPGYRWGGDGSLQAIPGGPADSTGKNSKATDTQRVTALYADRAREAENILSGVKGEGGVEGQGTSFWQNARSRIPGVGNYAVSNDFQKYNQAKRNFVNAVLRKESGAVISKEEFENADKQYFPQPGDERNPEIMAQKRANRETAIEGLKRAAGTAMNPQGQPAPAAPKVRTIVRTGTRNGKRVVQYSDGTIEDAP
jgi:hypothetical protein